MRLIAVSTVREWQEAYPDVKEDLAAWVHEIEAANWKTPEDVKSRYPRAKILPDNRVVFHIRGNRFRLIVHINYHAHIVMAKFFGTHAEYDVIDATTYGQPTNKQ